MKREVIEAVKMMWVVERHPKGAVSMLPLMEVLERNFKRWTEKTEDAGWEILGLFPTADLAAQSIRDLKRKRGEAI